MLEVTAVRISTVVLARTYLTFAFSFVDMGNGGFEPMYSTQGGVQNQAAQPNYGATM